MIPQLARVFVASTWYSTSGLSKKEKLYAKTRELVSGDRAEIISSGNVTYREYRGRK